MARERMRGSSSSSSISSRSSQTHSRVLRWQLGSYQDSSPLRNRGRAVLKLLHDLGVHGLLILIQQRLMGKGETEQRVQEVRFWLPWEALMGTFTERQQRWTHGRNSIRSSAALLVRVSDRDLAALQLCSGNRGWLVGGR